MSASYLPLVLIMLTGVLLSQQCMSSMNEHKKENDSVQQVSPNQQTETKDHVQDAHASESTVKRPRRRFTKEEKAKMAKLMEIEKKMEKLYEILKICDDENFDISKIELPKSWSQEYRAMMVLSKIAASKLIRDRARYQRTMDNCNAISRLFEEAQEKDTVREKMSGVYESDITAREKLEKSPLDDMKSRFTSFSNNKLKQQHRTEHEQNSAPTQTWSSLPQPTLSIAKDEVQYLPIKLSPLADTIAHSGRTPTLIQFL